jgi:hypothetical protein
MAKFVTRSKKAPEGAVRIGYKAPKGTEGNRVGVKAPAGYRPAGAVPVGGAPQSEGCPQCPPDGSCGHGGNGR